MFVYMISLVPVDNGLQSTSSSSADLLHPLVADPLPGPRKLLLQYALDPPPDYPGKFPPPITHVYQPLPMVSY